MRKVQKKLNFSVRKCDRDIDILLISSVSHLQTLMFINESLPTTYSGTPLKPLTTKSNVLSIPETYLYDYIYC